MPDWKDIVRHRLADMRLEPHTEADLADELAQHLEDRYRELRSGGTNQEDAQSIVLSEFGAMDPLAAATRGHRLPKLETPPAGDARRGNFADDLWRDLRYALRTMRKSPVFVVFVVATLALGIGANTTVFTLVNAMVFNPLPIADSAGLVGISGADVNSTAKSSVPLTISRSDLKDYEAGNHVFDQFAGYTTSRMITLQEGASERMFAELVTHNYFQVLGLTPAKGRFFVPDEDSTPGANPVAVLSHGTWTSRFGASEDTVGRKIRLNGIVYTIIGVAPPKFIGVNAIFGPDLWIPAAMAETLLPNELHNALSDRSKALFTGIGRLKAGVTRGQAQADLQTIASALAHEYPATNEGRTVSVRPIHEVAFGTSNTGSTILFASAALLAVVAIVLLIACSNVANLLLARAASRRQEMAVRLAMGANRRRLIRQLLTENMILGLLSGALGLFLAYIGLQFLFGLLPSGVNFASPRLDVSVLVFTLAISVATTFLFGTMPAFHASRANIADTLKEEARTTGRSRRRITVANALVAGQVALSSMLLVMAALFLRSIERAYQMDPGFQTSHLAVFMTNPGQAGLGKPQTKSFYKAARQRVASIPGVTSVSWASNLPLWARPVEGVEIEGHEKHSRSEKTRAILTIVDLDYFRTAGVSMVSGREFNNVDRESSTPVAIVNEKMAQDYWPAGALGRRIQLPGETELRQIVGVAKTANYTSWGEAPQACVYVPLEQNYSDGMTLFVRSERNPSEVLLPVANELRSVAPGVLVGPVRSGSELVYGGLFQVRMGVGLLTAFGLLALALASIGLYGILVYSVNQRRREIGLRMALGATPSSVRRLVLTEGMSLVGTGVLIGLAAAIAVGRLLSGMLFGVSAADPLSLGAAILTLSAIAMIACYLPAVRATRVDPVSALHEG